MTTLIDKPHLKINTSNSIVSDTLSRLSTFAAISDIHSNVFALQAVLDDIKKREIDQIVNLGDILYGPIAPRATYELLMAHDHDIMTIRGNQDRQIYDASALEIAENPTMGFIWEDLPAEAIEWLRELPFDCQLTKDIYLCHGTPTDDMIYLLEDVSSGAPMVRADKDVIALLAGNQANIIICGHTHIPRTVTLSTNQLIVNTGSVGYPAYEDDLPVVHQMQNYCPQASYAIIETQIMNDGTINKVNRQVSHIKVPYDFESAAQLAARNGRDDWAFALRTGRVKRNEG